MRSRELRIDRNPKNVKSKLYKILTRLFSGPIASYQRQNDVQKKKMNINPTSFDSVTGMTPRRGKYETFNQIAHRRLAENTRIERYSDFEQMDYEPVISSALNTYADEMTSCNMFEKILDIDSKNDEIKVILNDLFYNILNIEANLYSWARAMCKFGDYFLYIDTEEGKGVVGTINIPHNEIERLEGLDETNPNYVQFQMNQVGLTLEFWQIAHFKVNGDSKFAPYGASVLDGVRRTWRQLTLMEEFMISYRMTRAAERRVFYIDVGGIDPKDVEGHLENTVTAMRKQQIANPETGEIDRRYNAHSVEEDIFIPVRGAANQTRIDVLQGGQFTSAIDDIKFFQEKLFTGLQIPQEYLSRGEAGSSDRETLSSKDVKFSKVIQRLQKHLIDELMKIARIHLKMIGFEGNDLIDFKLKLNNPSKVAELQHLESLRTRLDIAGAAEASGFYGRQTISKEILGMTYGEFIKNSREIFTDHKQTALLKQMEPNAEAGMGDEFGSDLGSLPSMDDLDTGEGIENDFGGEEMPEQESDEDNSLLAMPGKRDFDPNWKERETPGSKGKEYAKKGGHFIRGNKQHHNYQAGITNAKSIAKFNEETSQQINDILKEAYEIYEA